MPPRLRRSAALALAGVALVASVAPAAAAPENKNSLDIAVECEGGSSFILVAIEFNAAAAGQLVGADGARVGDIVAPPGIPPATCSTRPRDSTRTTMTC